MLFWTPMTLIVRANTIKQTLNPKEIVMFQKKNAMHNKKNHNLSKLSCASQARPIEESSIVI